MNLALCVLTLVVLATSKLEVYMPVCASSKISKPIQYTLANFGHILYGQTIIGELYVPQNEEFCDIAGTPSISPFNDDIKRFILIKRGGCKFTKKILNAQKRGYELAIIYDNDSTSAPDVVMANDGHGHLVDIPSIFISNADGKNLISTRAWCDNTTILRMQFETYTSKVANVTLWLNANNRQTYITLRDFKRDYYRVIRKYIKVSLRFKVNPNCGHDRCEADDCITSNQDYCFNPQRTSGGVRINGKQILEEHLRSYFMFEEGKKKNPDLWWKYMDKFDTEDCIEVPDIKACSEKAMKNISFNSKNVKKLVKETYDNITRGEQNALKMFSEDAFRTDILFYPEATINGRNFYGLFRAPDIFEMICESLENPPTECHTFEKSDRTTTFGEDESKGLWKTIGLILVLMTISFFIALCVYTALTRRQANQQMSVEVNKMVEHYVALSEEKSKTHVNI